MKSDQIAGFCSACYQTKRRRARAVPKPFVDLSLPGEEWRPVSAAAGFYEVSSLGRIRRVAPARNSYPGRLIPGHSDGHNGYLIFTACCGTLFKRLKIHVVAADAFLGPRPSGQIINHIDGSKTHNAAANLEYVTQRENNLHAFAHGLNRPLRGELNGRHVLTEAAVRFIRTPESGGPTALARRLGVSKATVDHIRSGRIWKHIT